MHEQRTTISAAVAADTATDAAGILPGLPASERANVTTHGIGIALSVLGFFLLVNLTRNGREPAMFWSSIVYGLTLISVYTASTLYHAARDARRRRVLEIADHSAIYLLIAGTFTPFGVRLGGVTGIGLLSALWGLAVFGVLFKIFCGTRYEAVSLTMYLLMGWGPILVLKAIFHATSWSAVEWLVLGGLCYTVGVPVYVLSHKNPRLHMFWHLAVMLGSVCHFISVLYCIRAGMA